MSDYAKPDSEKFRAFYVQKRRKKRKSIVQETSYFVSNEGNYFVSNEGNYFVSEGK